MLDGKKKYTKQEIKDMMDKAIAISLEESEKEEPEGMEALLRMMQTVNKLEIVSRIKKNMDKLLGE